jgi:predicted TIM-barrel fold metal-dependent hydrolase
MEAVDVHQHLWPEPVLRALERRSEPPFARWNGSAWRVAVPGEPEFAVEPVEHVVERRAAAVSASGLARAIVSLSSLTGVEALPEGEAFQLLEAWAQAADDLPGELGWWTAIPLQTTADSACAWLQHALDRGAAGLCLPASALTRPEGAATVAEALDALERWQLPLFVHPGPAGGGVGDPAWWAPCASYVSQLHAAWHGVAAWVRPRFPRLRVVFAALGGLAPLHAERLRARGGPDTMAHDELAFYEPSSYGPRAVRAMGIAVGTAQLVHGTDHPVVRPAADPIALAFGDAAASLARRDNAARLLGAVWQPV